MSETTNLLIIGSGPAAWTAAIYASRALLSPVVLAGEQSGGQLMFTTEVENYPGFESGIKGPDLMAAMRKQAERFGTRVIEKDATRIERDKEIFKIFHGNAKSENFSGEPVAVVRPSRATSDVASGDGEPKNLSTSVSVISAKSVIIATGAKANTLKLPGEDRLMGRGVGTCAVCDAPFYRGKDLVFVIGGGDSAIEEATALSKFAKKVVILVRSDALRASGIMKESIKKIQNIEIWYKSQAKEFIGSQKLEKVRVDHNGKVEDIAAQGLFYAIGHTPATQFLNNSGIETDTKGYIKTYIDYGFGALSSSSLYPSPYPLYPTATSLPGVFAAGDCVDPRYRQAIVAAGQGCMAALDAEKWLDRIIQ